MAEKCVFFSKRISLLMTQSDFSCNHDSVIFTLSGQRLDNPLCLDAPLFNANRTSVQKDTTRYFLTTKCRYWTLKKRLKKNPHPL